MRAKLSVESLIKSIIKESDIFIDQSASDETGLSLTEHIKQERFNLPSDDVGDDTIISVASSDRPHPHRLV